MFSCGVLCSLSSPLISVSYLNCFDFFLRTLCCTVPRRPTPALCAVVSRTACAFALHGLFLALLVLPFRSLFLSAVREGLVRVAVVGRAAVAVQPRV